MERPKGLLPALTVHSPRIQPTLKDCKGKSIFFSQSLLGRIERSIFFQLLDLQPCHPHALDQRSIRGESWIHLVSRGPQSPKLELRTASWLMFVWTGCSQYCLLAAIIALAAIDVKERMFNERNDNVWLVKSVPGRDLALSPEETIDTFLQSRSQSS
ncbi:hypothetical protein WAI453_009585 [Rhynchosporium graminicola]